MSVLQCSLPLGVSFTARAQIASERSERQPKAWAEKPRPPRAVGHTLLDAEGRQSQRRREPRQTCGWGDAMRRGAGAPAPVSVRRWCSSSAASWFSLPRVPMAGAFVAPSSGTCFTLRTGELYVSLARVRRATLCSVRIFEHVEGVASEGCERQRLCERSLRAKAHRAKPGPRTCARVAAVQALPFSRARRRLSGARSGAEGESEHDAK